MKLHVSLQESLRRRTARASRRATRGALGWWAWSNADRPSSERRKSRGRRGSTLLVVMALLGMLMLLGMLYFTFASQEQANATFFAEAAKHIDDPGDDIDAVFDQALRQLIQGSTYEEKNSALWGGRHSLIFNMLGHDLQPFNGTGVHVYRPNAGAATGQQLIVDQDRNGVADSDQSLLELNDSPAARTNLVERRITSLPAPDVDYTAPDHNNAYLAYVSSLKTIWQTSSFPAALDAYPIIKPSFHRPEFLRGDDGLPIAAWDTTNGGGGVPFSTRGRLFRPHPNHLYVPRGGQNITTPPRRFLDDYNAADAADIASLSTVPPNRGFPFTKVPATGPVGPMTHRQQGIWNLTGTPTPPITMPQYEWDVDNDNDGTTDSIWMDLDLPLLVRPSDSATYIPLIAFMVQDLDGLLNLNAVGNLSGDTRTAATSDFGNGGDISRSSMGLSSPSEINPLWALDARPADAVSVSDHTSYFHAPTTIRHLANMEWWWFNKGRVEYTTPAQIYAGRYGEANRIWSVLSVGGPAIGVQMANSNLFPFPGIWDEDDNRDSNEGGPQTLAGVAGGQTLPIQHPLALNGMGRYWQAANPKRLNWSPAMIVGDPNRWLQYVGMGLGYDGNNAAGNVGWLNPFGGALMQNSLVGVNFATPGGSPVLIDDPGELIVDSKYLQRPYDEPLEPKDILFLFMSPSDRSRVGATSRFEDLMPGNITPNPTSSSPTIPPFYQLQVAKRFTSESWDVKQPGLPRFIPGPTGLGAVNSSGVPAPGVKDFDDNGDGVNDDDNERGWPGSDDDRAWEYNADSDNDQKLEFPPQFTPPAYDPDDPFRPQLRRLLTVEFGNTSTRLNPMRLNINEFLDVEHRPNVQSNAYTDPLAYRPLTPHSTDSTLATIPAVSPLPAYPPTSEGEKEFWARRDRQQMARDIYVLLYTFCGGNDRADPTDLTKPSGDVTKVRGVLDPSDPANASTPYVYHGKVCRQMAQFAVNLVDAMDRDNVMTAFEYDDNLLDGWNLDDDFTTNDSSTLPSTSRRFVVYGVEAQELAFSEALWVYQPMDGANDYPVTPFNEKGGDHNFLHIELRNLKPETLDLVKPTSLAANQGIWRIRRDDDNDGSLDATENAVEILKGTTVSISPVPPSQLGVGQLYTIASADYYGSATPADPQGASLYVDTNNGSAGAELQAPNTGGAAYPPAMFTTEASLDLIHADHNGYFALTNPGSGLLNSTNPGATITEVDLYLERRLNPSLIQLPLTANPYAAVDSFQNLSRQSLGLANGDTPAMANAKLAALNSRERRQPLDANNVGNSAGGTGPAVLVNTLSDNSVNPTVFTFFQPHFDRDFASVIELFDVPLDGPDRLTRILADSRRPPNLFDNSGNPIGQLENGGPFTFGAAVLMQSEDRDGDGTLLSTSDDTDNNGFQNGTETDSNGYAGFDFGEDINKNGVLDAHPYHFHRLLSLVEVPTRTHRQLGDPLKLNRVPGRINLNTVRAPHVLAGLIDDRQVIGPPERTGVDIDGDGTIEPGLQGLDIAGVTDTVEDSTGANVRRDWWFQFLIARDGLDPTTSLPLPVSGSSRPFRDLSYLRYDQEFEAQSTIEDTILRELPGAVKYTGSNGKGKGKGKAKGKTGGGSGAAGPADGRRLFELVTEEESNWSNTAASPPVEPKLRHRLLSKMFGNTTTRSNAFVVHVTIGMFACREYPDGSVRIGGEMDVDGDGSPDRHRAMFIVDRSTAEEAYDKGTRTFDWKKLILAKQRIN